MWLTCVALVQDLLVVFGILTVVRMQLRRKWGSVRASEELPARDKIVLITGANSGIGRAAAMEFARRDATVILACRDMKRAEGAVEWIRSKTLLGKLVCMKLDLGSLNSVREFCHDFRARYERLDILVNNAGVMVAPEEKRKTADGFEIHMGVNHLGHFLLTNLLLEELKKGAPSRIVNVSSMAHTWYPFDIDDIMSEHKPLPRPILPSVAPNVLYSRSKTANCLFTKELARRLHGTGVRSFGLCPGAVVTDICQNMKGVSAGIFWALGPIFRYLAKSSQEGAATILYCALNKELGNVSGEMYQHCGFWDPKIRPVLLDEEAEQLWDLSAKLVAL